MVIVRKKSTGEIFIRNNDGTYKGPYKDVKAAKRARARIERHEAMLDIGMTRVRSATGKIFYE